MKDLPIIFVVLTSVYDICGSDGQSNPYQLNQYHTPNPRRNLQNNHVFQQNYYRKHPSKINKAHGKQGQRRQELSYQPTTTTSNPNNLGIADALGGLMELKLFGIGVVASGSPENGFVRLSRVLTACDDLGMRAVEEALKEIRTQGAKVIEELEKTVEQGCKGIIGEAETQCSQRIEDVLERYQDHRNMAVEEGQKQCSQFTKMAIKRVREEVDKLFKRGVDERKMVAEEVFMQRVEEQRKSAEEKFEEDVKNGRKAAEEMLEEAIKKGEQDLQKGKAAGEKECTDNIKQACGSGDERDMLCDKSDFFTGNIDDYYYDDEYDDGNEEYDDEYDDVMMIVTETTNLV